MAASIALASDASAQASDAQPAARSITSVRGDLYRVDAGGETTVFLVTPQGIILGDPLDRATSAWLKTELASRFPDRPVRVVVLTGHRFDRVEGASTFAATSTRVAHLRYNAAVREARGKLPAALARLDANRNGSLEMAELVQHPRGAALGDYDRDKNGQVTPAELYAYVGEALSDFPARRTLSLGGKTVELIYAGPGYGETSTALYFPDERALFFAECPEISAAFSFGEGRVMDVTTWWHDVAQLQFDTLLSGRGIATTHADVLALAKYLDDLVGGLIAGIERGHSRDRLRTGAWLEAHRDTPYYARRHADIEYVYENMRLRRIGLYGAAATNTVTANATYCDDSFASCEWGGVVPAVTTGITVSFRRRLTAAIEMRLAGQSEAFRSNPFYDDRFGQRETNVSFLLGYNSALGERKSYNVVAGTSLMFGHRRGVVLVRERLVPAGHDGRFRFEQRDRRFGVTAGVDWNYVLGPRLTLVLPVRVTRAFGGTTEPYPGSMWPAPTAVEAGLGFRWWVSRQAH